MDYNPGFCQIGKICLAGKGNGNSSIIFSTVRGAPVMTRGHAVLTGPFFVALLAIAFCIWSALGNDVNFCVTTGCTLYQDFTIGGISLWWYGTGAFIVLAACALLGQQNIGRWLASFFVLGDVCLLCLMALTAPCVSCLVAAVFFALSYFLFRRSVVPSPRQNPAPPLRRSILLLVWLFLFVANLGQVARSQVEIWPIFDESGEARTRMFFSPSCRYCAEGINILSGNVNVAFYPVAESDSDIYRIIKMRDLLREGMTMAEALGQSADVKPQGLGELLKPENMLLRFRLLSNKAHVFSAGSQGVPFFENLGLTPDLVARIKDKNARNENSAMESAQQGVANGAGQNDVRDANLPAELNDFGQCTGQTPCPPEN